MWSRKPSDTQGGEQIEVKFKVIRGHIASLSVLLLQTLLFPSCFNWMRRQISAAWLPSFFILQVKALLETPPDLYPLPGCWIATCQVAVVSLFEGVRRDRQSKSCILRGLCDRVRVGCKHLMNTFQLTPHMCLHALTSWMWAFVEKAKKSQKYLYSMSKPESEQRLCRGEMRVKFIAAGQLCWI